MRGCMIAVSVGRSPQCGPELPEGPFYNMMLTDLYKGGCTALALFVPWEDFLRETTADIDSVWRRCRDSLPGRLQCVVNNAQLLRQSAEDARRDAWQWAATSGEGDLSMDVDDNVPMDGRDDGKAAFRSDEIGDAGRLLTLSQVPPALDR